MQLEQSLVSARFEKEAWKNITSFNWEPFTDPDLKRKFRLISVLGPSALPEEKLTQVGTVHGLKTRFEKKIERNHLFIQCGNSLVSQIY